MSDEQNKAAVHEIMQDLRTAVTKLLPHEWTSHWNEPDIDALALIRGLSQTVEELSMQIDSVVLRVQSDQISPEQGIEDAHAHILTAVHRMVPSVDVKQRVWRRPQIGNLVELAQYQLAVETLMKELVQLQNRLEQAASASHAQIEHGPPPPTAEGQKEPSKANSHLPQPLNDHS